jgi:Outer membrane protein beta-barrel domain
MMNRVGVRPPGSVRGLDVVGAVVLMLALGSAALSAQMAIGISGGANRATSHISLDGTSLETGTRTQAFNAFAWMYVGFEPWFGLQGGAGFDQKGPDSLYVDATRVKFTINYIDFPLMAVGTFPSSGLLKVRAFAGPSLNLKVGCASGTGSNPVLDCNQDAVKNVEISAKLGGGLKLGHGAGGVTLDVLYDVGLTNINNTDQDINLKNRTLMVSLGFLLQFPELTAPQLR